LGYAKINIATFHLGRRSAGGEAILLLSVDDAVTPELIAKVRGLAGVKTAMALKF
jgi:D-3-phosphoglycerate dehydrogenase